MKHGPSASPVKPMPMSARNVRRVDRISEVFMQMTYKYVSRKDAKSRRKDAKRDRIRESIAAGPELVCASRGERALPFASCVKLLIIYHAKISTIGLPKSHLEPFVAGDLEPAWVEAELVQDRGVDVGDVVAISTAWKPSSSVAPWTTPPLMPPPASQTEKP